MKRILFFMAMFNKNVMDGGHFHYYFDNNGACCHTFGVFTWVFKNDNTS